ncbi:MAG TPA: hypothetical protein VFU81_17015, partial [Thermomicrobiales bacterium]|nr:hypothetical protein [Thermomicrobiales bacterium]
DRVGGRCRLVIGVLLHRSLLLTLARVVVHYLVAGALRPILCCAAHAPGRPVGACFWMERDD